MGQGDCQRAGEGDGLARAGDDVAEPLPYALAQFDDARVFLVGAAVPTLKVPPIHADRQALPGRRGQRKSRTTARTAASGRV
ncbi:MAG: hypothetical protein IPK17_11480 [Chloroflexi bacterium]|uniref:hypothetical protein n=1 Tax=Candidatus Flexifilum breve TaxID=3140694 RepID=UPI003135695B|nr:hypothetical protein [Chloroflexota bacterium]